MTTSSRVPQMLLAVVLLAVSIGVALHLAQGRSQEAEEEKGAKPAPLVVPMATVHRGAIQEPLVLTGTLQPLPGGESKVAAQVSGRVAAVAVRLGQRVTQGQLLVALSRPELTASQAQAEAAATQARRELQALEMGRQAQARALATRVRRAEADLQTAQAHADLVKAGSRPEEVDRAEAALQSAQADLDGLRAGARPQEIAQAEAAVRDARAELAARRKSAQRKRLLLTKGIAAAQDVERADADLVAGQAALDSRQQALALLRAGSRPEALRAQEAKVREAQSALQQAKAGPRPQEVREADAQVRSAQAALSEARAAELDLRSQDQRIRASQSGVEALRQAALSAKVGAGRQEVRSPIDGTVTQVLVNPGEGVTEQTPVAVVLGSRGFRASVQVPANVAARLRPGSTASLVVPGLAGLELPGVVQALLPDTDPVTGLRLAEVRLRSTDPRLAVGMPVTVTVSPGGLQVLLVPTRALLSREGERLVYRVEGGAAHEQAVETGRESDGFTEITKGLKEGDRVVADGSLSLAEGTPVSPRR